MNEIVKEIIKEEGKLLGGSFEYAFSRRHFPDIVEAKRKVAIRLKALNYTHARIAKILKYKKHTSITYLLRTKKD